jgi:hypothetical protein
MPQALSDGAGLRTPAVCRDHAEQGMNKRLKATETGCFSKAG